MRLLVLSPIFPDAPSDGDRLRLFQFMKELSSKHELSLLSFRDPARAEDQDLSEISKIASRVDCVSMPRWKQWGNALARYGREAPSNVSAYASQRMRQRLESLLALRSHDAVFCYRLRMVPYALQARLPRVIDFTDSLTRYFERRVIQARGFKAALWAREAEKIGAYEAWAAGQFDAAFMNSEADAQTLRAMSRGAKVLTAANGVDLRFLKPGRLRRDPERMVFVGHLAYPPNAEAMLWFLRDIFPKIRKARPKASLDIIGGSAPSSLKAYEGQAGLRFHGFVKDFRPLLWAAGFSVCPVRLAAGRQNKILDAFATGTPVLATALTAAGVEAKAEKDLLTAETAEEFAAQALRLMERPVLGRGLAIAAYAFVKARYSWGQSARIMDQALKEAL